MNTVIRRFSSILLWTALTLTVTPVYATNQIGKLYTMTNATTGNEILVYNRLSDGGLTKIANISSNGKGTGTGLGNQGALTFSQDGFFLFAVNPGSNTVSSFLVTPNGLKLVSTVSSGGTMPVSVTEDRGRLFVLNAGNADKPGNILGFHVTYNGQLKSMPYTNRLLSSNSASTGAAQINFSDNGNLLIVTEKATNLILTYHVNPIGIPSRAIANKSSGMTPFGFAVGKRAQIFVSNAEGGATNVSSLSSYRLLPYGKLRDISPEVVTGETAACWVALSPDGRYAYTTNTASGTISSFQIELDGKVSIAESKAGITGDGSGPIDMVVSPESRYLYTLNAGNESISSFEVGLDGTLKLVKTLENLPDSANGLIAR